MSSGDSGFNCVRSSSRYLSGQRVDDKGDMYNENRHRQQQNHADPWNSIWPNLRSSPHQANYSGSRESETHLSSTSFSPDVIAPAQDVVTTCGCQPNETAMATTGSYSSAAPPLGLSTSLGGCSALPSPASSVRSISSNHHRSFASPSNRSSSVAMLPTPAYTPRSASQHVPSAEDPVIQASNAMSNGLDMFEASESHSYSGSTEICVFLTESPGYPTYTDGKVFQPSDHATLWKRQNANMSTESHSSRRDQDLNAEFDSRVLSAESLADGTPSSTIVTLRCPKCPDGVFKGNWAVRNLNRHVEEKHGSRTHKCEECGRGYQRSDALLNHKRDKHPNMPGVLPRVPRKKEHVLEKYDDFDIDS